MKFLKALFARLRAFSAKAPVADRATQLFIFDAKGNPDPVVVPAPVVVAPAVAAPVAAVKV